MKLFQILKELWLNTGICSEKWKNLQNICQKTIRCIQKKLKSSANWSVSRVQNMTVSTLSIFNFSVFHLILSTVVAKLSILDICGVSGYASFIVIFFADVKHFCAIFLLQFWFLLGTSDRFLGDYQLVLGYWLILIFDAIVSWWYIFLWLHLPVNSVRLVCHLSLLRRAIYGLSLSKRRQRSFLCCKVYILL